MRPSNEEAFMRHRCAPTSWWKAFLFAAPVVALGMSACGPTGASSSPPTATPTPICRGTTAAPGYTNGVAVAAGQTTSLSGAGGTFVAPMMSVWASTYAGTAGVQVAYQSVGSGAGIKQ